MLRTHLLPLLLLALATTMPLAAQEIRCDEQPATTLEELLRPDGTFREEIGFRGAVDARGWRITTDSAGRPRFVRSDTMHLDAAAVPDDEYWSAFALPGVNGVVEALLVRDGLVYIGGNFTKAGGEDAGYVAVWNSVNYQFSNLSGGVNGAVYALALDGNDLFVGGSFTRAGSVTVANVARYDLTAGTWHAMGDAAAAGVETPANIAFVRALAVAGDTVHVGGRFTRAGGRTANSIAAYSRSSNQWSALGVGIGGLDATVWALHQIGPQLYVGGRFTTAGGLRSRSIAMWDRSLSQWAPFDSGVNGVVRSFASQGQELYVGGDYNRIQNVPTPNVARMNIVSRRITRLGNPAAAGQNFGIYQPVHAVALGSRGLYVGGLFDRTATNVPVRRIVLWDGSTWRALSSGVAGVGVNAIAVEDERVFAGGDFTGAGERIVNYVAQYGGGNWQGLANAPDNGVNGNVYAVASDGNTLFVGGDFTVAGGVRVSRIARWDGLAWSALAPGGAADLDGAVRALALSGDGLYAAGEFTRARRRSGRARRALELHAVAMDTARRRHQRRRPRARGERLAALRRGALRQRRRQRRAQRRGLERHGLVAPRRRNVRRRQRYRPDIARQWRRSLRRRILHARRRRSCAAHRAVERGLAHVGSAGLRRAHARRRARGRARARARRLDALRRRRVHARRWAGRQLRRPVGHRVESLVGDR